MSAADTACLAGIDAVILAGGLGTRIRDTLGDTPKVLAPVAGKALLEHLLDGLERFGADRVVLCLGHLADTVIEHLRARPPRRCRIDWVIETSPQGTAGAVRLAHATLRPGPALVLNGDTLVDADLCRLLATHRSLTERPNPVLATLLCLEMDDTGRYGRLDVTGSQVQRFAEKAETGPGLINAGVYVMNTPLLDRIAAEARPASLERDVFQRLAPGELGAHVDRFRFVDLGTPASLIEAQQFFTRS